MAAPKPMLSRTFSGSALLRGGSYVVKQGEGVKMEPVQHPELNYANMTTQEIEQAIREACPKELYAHIAM